MPAMEPIKQHVKYIGPKKLIRVDFPVPFICKADHIDTVEFVKNQPTPLSPEFASQLCKVAGETFQMCDAQGKGLRA